MSGRGRSSVVAQASAPASSCDVSSHRPPGRDAPGTRSRDGCVTYGRADAPRPQRVPTYCNRFWNYLVSVRFGVLPSATERFCEQDRGDGALAAELGFLTLGLEGD